MSAPHILQGVLETGRRLRQIDEQIYSVLPETSGNHLYDKRAGAYDLFVRMRLYNRLLWGAHPADYEAFARRALASTPDGGLYLDAGCGSLLFTAALYAETERAVICFDQSLEMLRRGRERLRRLAPGGDGRIPERILLVQADLSDLPFRAASFDTILFLNVLHQYAEAARLMKDFRSLLVAGGELYLTSLVIAGRFVGDLYLDLLHRSGEFVRPRAGAELKALLADAWPRLLSYELRGNMAYAVMSA